MIRHIYIRTSDLPKKEREKVIDLELQLFFHTESGEIQIIDKSVFKNKDLITDIKPVENILKKYKAYGVIVDDAEEVN